MDDNMSQLKNKKIRIKHLNENDKKFVANYAPNNNKISKFLSRKKGMFQITCVSMDNMRKMSNNMYSEDSTDETDDIHGEENLNVSNDVAGNQVEAAQVSDNATRDDYSQLFFTTSSLGCSPIIPTSSQYGLAIMIHDMVLNGQHLPDYHLHIGDNGVKIIGNDLKDLQTNDLNQNFKVVKIESTEPFKRGRWTCMDYLEHSAIQVPPERDDNDGKHVEFEDQDLSRKRSSELSRRSIRKSGINKVSVEKDGRKLRHGRKASLKPLKKMSEHQNARNDKLYALSSNSSDIQKKNKKKNKCNALYNLSTDQILQKIDSFEDKLFKKIFTVEEDQMHPNYSTNNIVYEIKHLEIKNNTANSFDSETTCGDQTPTQSSTGEIPAMQSPQSAQQMKPEEQQKPAENPGKLEQKIDSENSMKIQEIVESQEAKKEMEKSQVNEGVAGKFQVESQMEIVEKGNEKIKNETMENQGKLEEMKEEGAISMKIVESEPPPDQSQSIASTSASEPVSQNQIVSRQPVQSEVKEEQSNEEGENSSEASGADIDNKIGQAMDLVKSHLMFAVREEVEILKEKITELMDRINQLEVENSLLKANASPETLHKLSETVPQREEQQKHLLEQRQQKQHQLQQLLLQQQLQRQQLLLLLQQPKKPKITNKMVDYQRQILENQMKLDAQFQQSKSDDKNDQNQMDGNH